MSRSQARIQAWTLESRTRYALVWGGINVLIVGGLLVALGSLSVPRDLWILIPVVLIHLLLQGWISYPRAKQRLTTRTG